MGGLGRISDLGLAAAIVAALALGALVLRGPSLTGRPRVVDGDTIELDGRRLRLSGMDAPEMAQTCTRPSGAYPCGEVARAGLQDLIGHEPVTCRVTGTDRYGRGLATCRVGERDLGSAMVRAGLAVSYGAYAIDELEAAQARRGLWAGTFERPDAWRRAHTPGTRAASDVR